MSINPIKCIVNIVHRLFQSFYSCSQLCWEPSKRDLARLFNFTVTVPDHVGRSETVKNHMSYILQLLLRKCWVATEEDKEEIHKIKVVKTQLLQLPDLQKEGHRFFFPSSLPIHTVACLQTAYSMQKSMPALLGTMCFVYSRGCVLVSCKAGFARSLSAWYMGLVLRSAQTPSLGQYRKTPCTFL